MDGESLACGRSRERLSTLRIQMRVSNLRMALPRRRSPPRHSTRGCPRRIPSHDTRVHPGNDSFPTIPVTSTHIQRPQAGPRVSVRWTSHHGDDLKLRFPSNSPKTSDRSWVSITVCCKLKVLLPFVRIFFEGAFYEPCNSPEISFARPKTCWVLVR